VNNRWASLPNRITALRMGALPVLWFLAALGETTALAIGLTLAASTDVLDGVVARRTGRITTFGSRLDSLADHLLTASTLVWLVWLRPEFVSRERVALFVLAGFGLLVLLVGWVRFGAVGGAHLYSAKLASVIGYVAAIGVILLGGLPHWIVRSVVGIALLAALETLAVFLTRSSLTDHSGSIFLPSPARAGRATRTP
jgi:cardiolipin synthase